MIKLNGLSISEAYRGTLQLGRVRGLYVSGETGAWYTLYGTLFKKECQTTVTTPSGKYVFSGGRSIEDGLLKQLAQRQQLTAELSRLEVLRSKVVEGQYDYGISGKLVETLEYLSENSTRQLPSVLIGGELDYDLLLKPENLSEDFQGAWETWSHVEVGRKKYNDEKNTETKMFESSGFLVDGGAGGGDGVSFFERGISIGMPIGFILNFNGEPINPDSGSLNAQRIVDDDIRISIGGVPIFDERRNSATMTTTLGTMIGSYILNTTEIEVLLQENGNIETSQYRLNPDGSRPESPEIVVTTVLDTEVWLPGSQVTIDVFDGWATSYRTASWEVRFIFEGPGVIKAPIQGGSIFTTGVSVDSEGVVWELPDNFMEMPTYTLSEVPKGPYWFDGIADITDRTHPGTRPIDTYHPNGSFILG